MNLIGNLTGWERIYYPDGFRPSRSWVTPFMRVLGWETSWGDRHTARMSEVEVLSRAQRIVTGKGAGRLWLGFAMDLLYLERSRLYQQYSPQASHLRRWVHRPRHQRRHQPHQETAVESCMYCVLGAVLGGFLSVWSDEQRNNTHGKGKQCQTNTDDARRQKTTDDAV